MDFVALTVALVLPWAAGTAIVLALPRGVTARDAPGELAWAVGTGGFAGWLVLTLWMRALSALGVPFGAAAIALPVALLAALVGTYLWRTQRAALLEAACGAWRTLRGEGMVRWQRVAWWALLAWLAVRALLLLFEVAWRPLFPWDAWIQWATKARVWYELGRMAPFERAGEWFAAAGAAYFDAAPNYPATVPLIQVWVDVMLGRWDDALMNLPWWQFGVALAFVIYGALRRIGYSAPAALAGTWVVVSLPLVNVHVALAGYADLPLACCLLVAALALWRWAESRSAGDLALAIAFALACPLVKVPGIVWALTLVPGLVVVLFPRRGLRLVGAGFALVLGALLVLARTHPVVLNYRLHLEFDPAWAALVESFFLLGNWHIFWYAAVAVVAFSWRELRLPRVLPLTVIVAAGAVFLFVAFAFTNARAWVADQTTVNRATLHLVPLLAVWLLAVFRARIERAAPAAAPQAA